LYYSYFPLWRAFFTELGVEVVVSPKTNRTIIDAGLRSALDETCLPVKLFFGHVLELAGSVDYLFVPRLISVEPGAYICPKFMGLPDMLRARIPDLPPLIDVAVDFSRGNRNWDDILESVGRLLVRDRRLIRQACRSARTAQDLFQEQLERGRPLPDALAGTTVAPGAGVIPPTPVSGRLNIALLGHAYNIYDDYISMNLTQRLRELGAQVSTADLVPQTIIDEQADALPKKMFWTLGKKMIGAAFAFRDSRQFDGMIYLSSFGCGPESLVGELLVRWAKRCSDTPFMLLTIDEHTGTAGLITRLEAFTDMLLRRKRVMVASVRQRAVPQLD
jgi:predicted nucleotide-binding protein (sugar kinase/HSP70/actin superfamily)